MGTPFSKPVSPPAEQQLTAWQAAQVRGVDAIIESSRVESAQATPPVTEDEWQGAVVTSCNRIYATGQALNLLAENPSFIPDVKPMLQKLQHHAPRSMMLSVHRATGAKKKAVSQKVLNVDAETTRELQAFRRDLQEAECELFDRALVLPYEDKPMAGLDDAPTTRVRSILYDLAAQHMNSNESWVAAHLVLQNAELKSTPLGRAASTLVDVMRKAAVAHRSLERGDGVKRKPQEAAFNARKKVETANQKFFAQPLIHESFLSYYGVNESHGNCIDYIPVTALVDNKQLHDEQRILVMQNAGLNWLMHMEARREARVGTFPSHYDEAAYKMPEDLREALTSYVDWRAPTLASSGAKGREHLQAVEAVLLDVLNFEQDARSGDDFGAQVKAIVKNLPALRALAERAESAMHQAEAWLKTKGAPSNAHKPAVSNKKRKQPSARSEQALFMEASTQPEETPAPAATKDPFTTELQPSRDLEDNPDDWMVVRRAQRANSSILARLPTSLNHNELNAKAEETFSPGTFRSSLASCAAHFTKHSAPPQSMEEYMEEAASQVREWHPKAMEALQAFKESRIWSHAEIRAGRRISRPQERAFTVSNDKIYLSFTEDGRTLSYRNRTLVGR